jgi:O-antigen ligase
LTRQEWSAARPVSVPTDLLSVLIVSYGLAVVALFALGSVSLSDAGLLLAVPVVLTVAVLRPEWTILILIALPPSLGILPPMQMIAITLVALFGCLLHGPLHLGPRTGIYPIIGLVALAAAVRADVSAEAMTAADATLKYFVYYALVMVVAFHAVVNGRMRIDTFATALLLGVVGATVLQPFVKQFTSFQDISQHPFRGHFAYLAVMGFGVAYVRFSLNRSAGRRESGLDLVLMLLFFGLTAISYSRSVWMSGLLIIAFVSKWTGRKLIWVVGALSLVVALSVPVIGQRILPGGTADLARPERLAEVTTGRSGLWGRLWERGADALPFGQGWGYVTSLQALDIFGFEGHFEAGESSFVYPHNDFIYLFVDLGIPGVALLTAFWVFLVRKIMRLSRGGSEFGRYGVRVLVPIIAVMFVLELFANGLSLRNLATRFFIAAGLIYGLDHLELNDARAPGRNRRVMVGASG